MLVGRKWPFALIFFAAFFVGKGHELAVAQQCLSAAELNNVGRMAAAGGIALGIQQCAHCLTPERFKQSLKDFELAGFLNEFGRSQAAIKTLRQEEIDYIDSIFGPYVAAYGKALSSDCEACRKTANAVEGLALSLEARELIYQTATADLAPTRCR